MSKMNENKSVYQEYRDKIVAILQDDKYTLHTAQQLADEILNIFIPKNIPQDMLDRMQAKPIGYGLTSEEYEAGMTAEEIDKRKKEKVRLDLLPK